jgi:hypothetical protein
VLERVQIATTVEANAEPKEVLAAKLLRMTALPLQSKQQALLLVKAVIRHKAVLTADSVQEITVANQNLER